MAVKPKQKTRELILSTSLELFNEQGSHKVTTNHIAQHMGISPGNLYYHFKNKEHIVRELLERLIQGFDLLVCLKDGQKSGLDLVVDTINATGRLIHTYRFIYIELAALLARDSLFKGMYHDIKARRAEEFIMFFDTLDPLGVFRQKIIPRERDAIIFILWTYTEGIITALHTSDIPVTSTAIQTHLKKIVYILKAYLQPELWTRLARKLELP